MDQKKAVIKYVLLEETSVKKLSVTVAELLNKGYLLHGPPLTQTGEGGTPLYLQCVMHAEEEEEK